MRLSLFRFLFFVLFALFSIIASAAQPVILTYHKVVEGQEASGYTVTKNELQSHMQWLRLSGWTILSSADFKKYAKEGNNFPKKSVLLMFDDAEVSTCTIVHPLLQSQGIPFTVAVVSNWIDQPQKDIQTCTWSQLKTLAKDPLVTIASHTHDLHKDVLANQWGGMQPATVTKQWLKERNELESNEEYFNRIKSDLIASKTQLEETLGVSVTDLVWPYGWYSKQTINAAIEAGFEATFALNNGTTSLSAYRRKLVLAHTSLGRLKEMLTAEEYITSPGKTIWLDLPISGITPNDNEKELSALINRLAELDVTKVVFSDFESQSKYASRVVWQIKNRAQIQPYIDLDRTGEIDYSQLNVLAQGALSKKCDMDTIQQFKDFYGSDEIKCYKETQVVDLRKYNSCDSLEALTFAIIEAKSAGVSELILPASVITCKSLTPQLWDVLRK